MSDYARSVQILVELAGDAESRLDNINNKMNQLSGSKVNLNTSNASNEVTKLTSNANQAGSTFQNLGSKMSGAFANVKTTLGEVKTSIEGMSTALMSMTVGGAISGLAWKQSVQAILYNEQVKEAINNNKKLGISYEELNTFVKGQAEAGEGTKQDTVKEMYSVLMAGSKYFKGSGEKKLTQADAITDFYFKHQEMMQEQGISSAEQMVQRAIMTEGKMSGRFGTKFATAMGVSPDDASMKSAKARMKYFMEQGATVNMKTEMDLRPWEQLEVNIGKLKYAIGDSIATPIVYVTRAAAGFVDLIASIPAGSAIIGYAGMFLAIASATSLVIGVMTPLYNLMKALNIVSGISTLLKTTDATATIADASSHAMLTGAMEGEFVATELTTTAQNVSLASRIRLIAATTWSTLTIHANALANTLGIASLLGLATAEGVASTGAWALAAGIWAVLSPLLPFIVAGAAIVGILLLMSDKAGILQPILEGLGNSFDKLKSGDISGAWKSLTNIKLPSMDEAKKSLTGALNISYILDKHLGIPLSSQVKYLEYIHDVIKKVREYIYSLWNTILSIWNWLIKVIPGAEKSQAKSKLESQAKREGISSELFPEWLRTKQPTSTRDISANVPYTLDGKKLLGSELLEYMHSNRIANTKDVESFLKRRVEVFSGSDKLQQLKTTYELTPGFAEEIAKAVTDGIGSIFDKLIETLTNLPETIAKSITGLVDSGFGTGTSEVVWTSITDTLASITKILETVSNTMDGLWKAISSVSIPGVGTIGEILGVPSAAIGGEVLKEGYAYVHDGEPIIPANIAQSSDLITLLGNIASSPEKSGSKSNSITINMNYTAPSNGSGIYLDKFSFERTVKEIVGKCTRQYGAY